MHTWNLVVLKKLREKKLLKSDFIPKYLTLRSYGGELNLTSHLSENQDQYKSFGLSEVKTKFLVNTKVNQRGETVVPRYPLVIVLHLTGRGEVA